jgi:hypothetical protein
MDTSNIKSKLQVVTIALQVGTTAAKRNTYVDLESEFKTCRGFYMIRNQGTDYLKIGIKDAAGNSIVEPVNSKHLEVSENPAIKDRFYKETPFEANGKKITISLENFSTTTAVQDIDVLFLLDNDNI